MGTLLPGPVYAIADQQALGERSLPDALRTMADAGIACFQIRAKKASGAELCRLTEACCEALEGYEAALWLDDRVDVAALFPVTGVHVGQRDLPAGAARKVLGPAPPAIGQSTHGLRQIEAAAEDPAVDVVAVGPIFPTRSKQDPDPVVGLDLLRRARAMTTKPLVAIGGIDGETLPRVLDAGADTAAVIGALCRGDLRKNSRRLLAAVEGGA